MTTDVRETSAPSWAIRSAYFDGEWLMLCDSDAALWAHTCNDRYSPTRYAVMTASNFEVCEPNYCTAIVRDDFEYDGYKWQGDTLAEAEAAFTRIEAEWLESKR